MRVFSRYKSLSFLACAAVFLDSNKSLSHEQESSRSRGGGQYTRLWLTHPNRKICVGYTLGTFFSTAVDRTLAHEKFPGIWRHPDQRFLSQHQIQTDRASTTAG